MLAAQILPQELLPTRGELPLLVQQVLGIVQ